MILKGRRVLMFYVYCFMYINPRQLFIAPSIYILHDCVITEPNNVKGKVEAPAAKTFRKTKNRCPD